MVVVSDHPTGSHPEERACCGGGQTQFSCGARQFFSAEEVFSSWCYSKLWDEVFSSWCDLYPVSVWNPSQLRSVSVPWLARKTLKMSPE
jgi:hypothetical protein